MPRLDPESEHKKIERVVRLIQMLTDPRCEATAYDLADEFRVDRRTILRDLDLLQGLGFEPKPGIRRQGRKKILRLSENGPLAKPLGFSRDELVSLYLTRGIYEVFRGTNFERAAQSALNKIEPYFDAETVERLQSGVRVKTGPVRDYARHNGAIEALTRAIVDRNPVDMVYFSEGSKKLSRLTVEPYTLLFYSNALYLVAFSPTHGAVRTFAVERVSQAKVLAHLKVPPRKSEKAVSFDDTFGIYSGRPETVRIWVAAGQKQRMKDKILHPSQKLSFRGDGSMVIELKVGGKEDLLRWILSQGEGVKLLEPKAWVGELRAIIRGMARAYSQAPA